MKRLAREFRRARTCITHRASKTHTVGDLLSEILPLPLWNLAERSPQENLNVPFHRVLDLRIQSPIVTEFAIDLEGLRIRERQVRRRREQHGRLVAGDYQRLLVAKRRYQVPERAYFRSCVQPEEIFTLRDNADHVVELSGGWHIRIEPVSGIDEGWVCSYAIRLQQRGEQRMLILAVAVLIAQNVSRRVRLVAPDPKGNTNISELGANVVVYGMQSCRRVRCTPREFSGFGEDLGCRLDAVPLQPCIPLAYLIPALEAAELYFGGRKATECGV